MTGPSVDCRPAKQDPEALALRSRPRPAIRFRRGMIIIGVASVSVVVVGLTWVALEPGSLRNAAHRDVAEQPRAGPPQAVAGAPATYGDVPVLGPPLPGDLGRAIVEQRREQGTYPEPRPDVGAPHDASAAEATDPAASAAEAARRSAVLVRIGSRPVVSAGRSGDSAAAGIMAGGAAPPAAASQAQKLAFTGAGEGEGDINPFPVTGAPGPWTLAAGTVIPAALITGLDSDLPGMVLAQVTEPVRDSATGRTVVIPQGARLVGTYDSLVAFGQRRALLVWTRILFPDGSSVRLDKMPATDASGYAGLEDKVDGHGWQLLKGVGVATVLGVGSSAGIGPEGDLVQAIREAAQQNGARAGDQLVSRNLDVQPTLKVRPGWPVRALVNKDLVLRPWESRP